MFGFGLLDWVKIGGGVALGLLIGFGAGDLKGYHSGRVAAESAARQHALELIKKRSKDNEEISGMDSAGLCTELGGKWVRDEQRCD